MLGATVYTVVSGLDVIHSQVGFFFSIFFFNFPFLEQDQDR
jgi:hypothetical protein